MSKWEYMTLEERFWCRVNKTDTCWLWTGAVGAKKFHGGYGVIDWKGKSRQATHVSWFLEYGRVPQKLICHTCDTPLCVRPAHLFEGSYKDNAQDSIKKGRWQSGERHWCHRNKAKFLQVRRSARCTKLTALQVAYIKWQYRNQKVSQQKLANEYNVCQQSILLILQNKNWRGI